MLDRLKSEIGTPAKVLLLALAPTVAACQDNAHVRAAACLSYYQDGHENESNDTRVSPEKDVPPFIVYSPDDTAHESPVLTQQYFVFLDFGEWLDVQKLIDDQEIVGVTYEGLDPNTADANLAWDTDLWAEPSVVSSELAPDQDDSLYTWVDFGTLPESGTYVSTSFFTDECTEIALTANGDEETTVLFTEDGVEAYTGGDWVVYDGEEDYEEE